MSDMCATLYKNQNCLTCEAVLSNTFDNLANDSSEAALTRSFASPAFVGLACVPFDAKFAWANTRSLAPAGAL